MSYRWDSDKAKKNFRKHGIYFADAVAVFEDENLLWQEDIGNYNETRFVVVGMDHLTQTITVIFTFRDETIRIISARKATNSERKTYENTR